MSDEETLVIRKDAFDLSGFLEFMATQSKESILYIGCDSTRKKIGPKKWQARYATVVVVHIDGKHGGRVFAEVVIEEDHDVNPAKPFNRMFTEAQHVVEMYERLKDFIGDRWPVHLHLDVNPDEQYGSNVAYQAASGFVRGVTGIEAACKPDAWSASFAADRVANQKQM